MFLISDSFEKKSTTQTNSHDTDHAHVYFGTNRKDVASRLLEKCAQEFSFPIRDFHETPIGPHPGGSCQIVFGSQDFVTRYSSRRANDILTPSERQRSPTPYKIYMLFEA
ncbi:MAG: DOPA 4,5-dioxygenase family protein [Gammaproteobacteria bacterium]